MDELKCPNCGHDIGEHGKTGCTHMNGVNFWCRCKYSACGINLDWLKREYQSLVVENNALRKQLEEMTKNADFFQGQYLATRFMIDALQDKIKRIENIDILQKSIDYLKRWSHE